MKQDLMDQGYRKTLIEKIKGDENVQRKIVSYKKQNMQNDNYHQYVKEYLESKLDPETVSELHIFSDVNLQKRISKSESGIYKTAPERSFMINDKPIEDFKNVYDMMNVDTCLSRANTAFKYQDQCAIQVYPENENLKCRVLLPHHYDVIPEENNPENAFAYIISNFDNTSRDKIKKDDSRTGFSQGDTYRDGANQEIADVDDPNTGTERYFVTSRKHNFVMNGDAEILNKETFEPITEKIEENDENVVSALAEYDCLPFIDVATEKDFEFWVRSGDSLYNATVMYNVILTSEFQTVEMQGHAQPYYKGDAEHMPENIRIGVDKMIFIPINPNNEVNSEFGFANPGSDLSGIREFRESFLSSFLSSRGLDTSIVSGKSSVNTSSSGIEKMLQMIEKFEASQEDFSLFKNVEQQLAEITACWIESLRGERIEGELILGEKYQFNIGDLKMFSLNLDFAKPELIKTEMETLEVAEKEIDMGVSSKVHYLIDHKGMTEKEAILYIKKVEEYEMLTSIEVDENDNDEDEVIENEFTPKDK
tara:strand:- start:21068 stop:22675 length:1608 start_codon:yes stop_codon:yes gene_type:complete